MKSSCTNSNYVPKQQRLSPSVFFSSHAFPPSPTSYLLAKLGLRVSAPELISFYSLFNFYCNKREKNISFLMKYFNSYLFPLKPLGLSPLFMSYSHGAHNHPPPPFSLQRNIPPPLHPYLSHFASVKNLQSLFPPQGFPPSPPPLYPAGSRNLINLFSASIFFPFLLFPKVGRIFSTYLTRSLFIYIVSDRLSRHSTVHK